MLQLAILQKDDNSFLHTAGVSLVKQYAATYCENMVTPSIMK
jgi:hypothetical protein